MRDWEKVAQRIQSKLKPGHRGILKCRNDERQDIVSNDGQTIKMRTGVLTNATKSITYEMIKYAFDRLKAGHDFDSHYFRKRYEKQYKNGPCRYSMVGGVLVELGLATKHPNSKDRRTCYYTPGRGMHLMSKVYIPSKNAEDWKQLLADPEKQWKRRYSARTLAYCWQDADGIPNHVKKVLCQATELAGLEALIVIPEHQVPLPGGAGPSQNDIWVLGRTEKDLVSIAVEGKVSEPFGPTIGEWGPESTPGKKKRFEFLCSVLGLNTEPPEHIRYQLLHRTASAIIEAERFHANQAVMLVHSFSPSDEWFPDYKCFVSLFGVSAAIGKTVSVGKRSGVSLHFAWVKGDEQYLKA